MFHVKPDLADLEHCALALPGATLDVKWGDVRVASVDGRMFATFHREVVAYKVAPDDFLALSGLPGVRPAPYLARARWIAVSDCSALTMTDLKAGLATSWKLVVQKLPRARRAFYSRPSSEAEREGE
ncbi:protein of unknown function [Pseudogulbenkiania sp. NH8B]|uniref:MmcQ/YjbR family DNA-binding protein n=1 Tax=Pseudogulbenkiania sp. (strain NH8B) TaxID=748280 RepID=UPI000227A449|nr:MmcQ/YjbR family DNA-binding protein [Pseudogulbenkiania sp. NH8B]BAK78761.1 protein of unknown function [Pseudogulbenkiania sp. NH8B]